MSNICKYQHVIILQEETGGTGNQKKEIWDMEPAVEIRVDVGSVVVSVSEK